VYAPSKGNGDGIPLYLLGEKSKFIPLSIGSWQHTKKLATIILWSCSIMENKNGIAMS
jgi:hypothetical protein